MQTQVASNLCQLNMPQMKAFVYAASAKDYLGTTSIYPSGEFQTEVMLDQMGQTILYAPSV